MLTGKTRWLLAGVAATALAAPTSAAALTKGARDTEEASRRQPVATTEAQALANQKQLAPTVKATIAEGGAKELGESTSSPDVRADLLRYTKVTRTVTHSPASRYPKPTAGPTGQGGPIEPTAHATRRLRAHAAGCYGSPWTQTNYNTYLGTISWVYSRENGWCGDGYRMTWLGGGSFASWSWGPYCQANQHADYSWDGWPTWVHMGNWGTVGISYPWGCWGFSTIHATLRINAGGYYDFYDDYGI